MTNSTRFKLSVFVTIVLTIVGVVAYIYDPVHIDKFAFYNINTLLPIVSYIIGRTVRSGGETKGLMQRSTRFKTAFWTFVGSLFIGIGCYIFSPENIDQMGMYMMTVVFPSITYILGRSFKGENKPEEAP